MGLRRKDGTGMSQTKIGTLLAGIGVILSTVGAYLLGELTLVKVIPLVISEIGIILGIFGLRDLPILNGRK